MSERFLKRGFDIVASAVGLVSLLPLIVVCALIARADTGVTGIYRQARVGRFGRRFKVLKIRTMRSGSDASGNSITVADDERVTRSGRIMKRYKLDELPQLWNVLVGEMSFVGPRPDVPGYADKLEADERELLQLRPGITGPATIKYQDEEELLAEQPDPVTYNDKVIYPDKVRINLDYLHNYRFMDDLRYILMTVGLVEVPPHLSVHQGLLASREP